MIWMIYLYLIYVDDKIFKIDVDEVLIGQEVIIHI